MITRSYRRFQPRGVFISRNLPEENLLRKRLAERGYHLVDLSLISVSPILFSRVPAADWIFFSSKNAIRHFFSQSPAIGQRTRYAVFGPGSAGYLAEYGLRADFIGEGNDAEAIGRAFAAQVEHEVVLFPQAIDSIQTVQRQLSFNTTAKNLYVYKTDLKTHFTLPKTGTLVFTSPSNVMAYFQRYGISPEQKVIAIGTTTRQTLYDQGIKEVLVPDTFSEASIYERICSRD
jgi:hydroxymethylbilane synthase